MTTSDIVRGLEQLHAAIDNDAYNELWPGSAQLVKQAITRLRELEDELSHRGVEVVSALTTIDQIRQIASGEVEAMDDDLADAHLKRIDRMCRAHLKLDSAMKEKGGG